MVFFIIFQDPSQIHRVIRIVDNFDNRAAFGLRQFDGMPLNLVPPVATSIRVRRDTKDGQGRVFGLLAAGKHGEHITSVHADIDLKPDDGYFVLKRPSEDLVGAQATWAHGDVKWSLSMGHCTHGSQSDIVACLSVESLNYAQESDVESQSSSGSRCDLKRPACTRKNDARQAKRPRFDWHQSSFN